MTTLNGKREMILAREQAFANAVGEAVFERPSVSLWMILIPVLFLYFIYRMQRYKSGRLRFDEEFMAPRRRAMDAALNALTAEAPLKIEAESLAAGLPAPLQPSFGAWIQALGEHYLELLSSPGESFEALVRGTYRSRTDYLLALNRLTAAEKAFYAALKPYMAGAEGSDAVIATIETHTQRLRREQAEAVFP